MSRLYDLHFKGIFNVYLTYIFSGMFVAAGCEICRHAEGKGSEEDATASDESLEYSRSQHGAALPDCLYL